jgi:putative nucleotidyltransferase with HDIG domain
MRKDFRKDLEKAARQMILVRRVETLTRLILRTITRNIRVRHAGIFFYDKGCDEFIIRVSQGRQGARVPPGFTKVNQKNSVIRYFTDPSLPAFFKRDFLLFSRIKYYLRIAKAQKNRETICFLEDLMLELSMYQAKAFVPGFYRNNLVGLLFLGDKDNRKSFSDEELSFLSVLASDVVMALQNARLFEDLNKQLDVNKKLFLNTVTALAGAIDAKDKYTMGHTARVWRYALRIARHLEEKPGGILEFEECLRIAALLHDIGKIGVPGSVLNKNMALNEEETKLIKTHPEIGAKILAPISEFKTIILGVKYHHEHYDGTGYPEGLSGEQIPLTAAIIAVADAFDAMTSNRPYRKAFDHSVAIEEIRRSSGKQFDPKIVAAFLKAFVNEGEKNSASAADYSFNDEASLIDTSFQQPE